MSTTRVVAAVTAAAAFAAGCGPARVAVEISFSSLEAQSRAGSVHVWVLEDEGVTCLDLVTGTADPYDPLLARLGDAVFLLPPDVAPQIEDVALGRALVYVEAVDRAGAPFLAGCTAARLRGGTDVVRVRLSAIGTFDCGDPATPPGAPCDDGFACSTGETCQGTSCTGGGPLDCSWLTGACSAAGCEEAAGGCVAAPVPDGTPCEDGLWCTEADQCVAGSCLATPRDCNVLSDACNYGDCDEATDSCVAVPLDGLPCSDGLYCTQFDACAAGTCTGTPRNCGFLSDDCNSGSCDEAIDACTQVPLPDGTSCTDFDACTMTDECLAGACTGVMLDGDGDGVGPAGCDFPADCDDGNPLESPNLTEGPMMSPTCTDGLDNDCDLSIDSADTGC